MARYGASELRTYANMLYPRLQPQLFRNKQPKFDSRFAMVLPLDLIRPHILSSRAMQLVVDDIDISPSEPSMFIAKSVGTPIDPAYFMPVHK